MYGIANRPEYSGFFSSPNLVSHSVYHNIGMPDGYDFLYKSNVDASNCNPIYGNSNTVQPASYTVYYIMKIR